MDPVRGARVRVRVHHRAGSMARRYDVDALAEELPSGKDVFGDGTPAHRAAAADLDPAYVVLVGGARGPHGACAAVPSSRTGSAGRSLIVARRHHDRRVRLGVRGAGQAGAVLGLAPRRDRGDVPGLPPGLDAAASRAGGRRRRAEHALDPARFRRSPLPATDPSSDPAIPGAAKHARTAPARKGDAADPSAGDRRGARAARTIARSNRRNERSHPCQSQRIRNKGARGGERRWRSEAACSPAGAPRRAARRATVRLRSRRRIRRSTTRTSTRS